MGAVIVPFDILLKKEEPAAVARASDARMVFTSTEYLAKVSAVCSDLGGTGKLVLFDDPGAAPGSSLATARGSSLATAPWPARSFGESLARGRAARAAGRDLHAQGEAVHVRGGAVRRVKP